MPEMKDGRKCPSGTKEWAKHNANIDLGCVNNCRYCYARHNALRFKKITDPNEWTYPVASDRQPLGKKRDGGTIMFPTTYDIVPGNIDRVIRFLYGTLEAGNRALIVSKPHLECIMKLCAALAPFKNQILFRFSIGSYSDHILEFWEPNAPRFESRYASLTYAKLVGFSTSISAEPLLDDPVRLYDILEPHVTDSIWFGMMNHIERRVDTRGWGSEYLKHLKLVKDLQEEGFVRDTYNVLKDEPKVKWKESYKKLLGLDVPEREGMDV